MFFNYFIMIPTPFIDISLVLKIGYFTRKGFLKRLIDPVICPVDKQDVYIQKIDACRNADDHEKYLLANFRLYARRLFKIENEVKNFSYGLLAIKDNDSGKWGFVNTDFKLIIPDMYDEVEDFNVLGHAAVKVNGHWRIITTENKIILPIMRNEFNPLLFYFGIYQYNDN
jgi:hypothetical protein